MKNIYSSGEIKSEISFDDGSTYVELSDVTSIKVSSDQNNVEWVPFDNGGWKKNYTTSKGMSFAIEKQYNPTSEADISLMEIVLAKTAYEHNYVKVKFTLPTINQNATSGATLEAETSLEITDIFSQGSEDVVPLNFTCKVNGAPTYTAEVVPPAQAKTTK